MIRGSEKHYTYYREIIVIDYCLIVIDYCLKTYYFYVSKCQKISDISETSDLNCETLFIASTGISREKKILQES